jgi:hypothetical protein
MTRRGGTGLHGGAVRRPGRPLAPADVMTRTSGKDDPARRLPMAEGAGVQMHEFRSGIVADAAVL